MDDKIVKIIIIVVFIIFVIALYLIFKDRINIILKNLLKSF